MEYRVIDFFSGAGGFSEGFRQAGFKIILGIDKWKSAIDTFNLNFDLSCDPKDILDFSSTEEIEQLPDTEIIIGSPPCVSFSNSNKSGNGDKKLGIKLTKIFLKIIAVKKHKNNSILKAWFMENVVNSKYYLKEVYTFKDLNLAKWASSNKINPNEIAVNLKDNYFIANSADYGAPQIRKRIIYGEIKKTANLNAPPRTNKEVNELIKLSNYKTLNDVLGKFPSPFSKKSQELITDPLYPKISLPLHQITDHFYDTGITYIDWENSKSLKVNHPYMGKMSFPENIYGPSRTVTATKIVNSREALIYKSEIERSKNGKYRTPTVREASILMGFPITFQFLGTENIKWKLVGNAVSPFLSFALAKEVKRIYELSIPHDSLLNHIPKIKNVKNLNTFTKKRFASVSPKNKGARFRRHPFKNGNMTVALSNYDIALNGKKYSKWFSSIVYGTGEGFVVQRIKIDSYKIIENLILSNFTDGKRFVNKIKNGFSEKIANKDTLQKLYEFRKSENGYLSPIALINEVKSLINKHASDEEVFIQKERIFKKKIIPKKQLYAVYAINKIISKANFE